MFLVLTEVPWDYPNLSNKSATTSPFTIIFKQFGSSAFYPLLVPISHIHFAVASASFMNTVILSSVVSAGNHALFAGTRVLYGLAQASQAPSLFAWTTPGGVPLPALLLTSSFSVLCFGSSFIGSGQLWAWLQNLVGVSNQVQLPLFVCFSRGVATPSLHHHHHRFSDVRSLRHAALRGMHVDRVVVDRDRVVAFSCRVENARPTALGDEVSCTVDVAVGPSFRGAHKPYPLNPQPLFSFHTTRFRVADYTNRWAASSRQVTAVSTIILGAYQQTLLFHSLFFFSPDN